MTALILVLAFVAGAWGAWDQITQDSKSPRR